MIHSAVTPHATYRQRVAAGLRITYFGQAAKSEMPRRYHESATLCVLLRGAARDILSSRIIEYAPGTAVYLPPEETHAHEFGTAGMVGIVIEVPTSLLENNLILDHA